MPLGTTFIAFITLIIGSIASLPILFDPEGSSRDSTTDQGLWNGRSPVKGRWYVPKPFPTPRPIVPKKAVEQTKISPAMWNDATRMVQSALSRIMDEIDFGLQLTERDQDLNDIMEQVRHLTGFVQDFYSDLKRHEGASNLMSIWKGTLPPGATTSTFKGDSGEGAGSNLSRFVRKGPSLMGTAPLTSDMEVPTPSPQHFVLPSTVTATTPSTEVPEIYYEIFKAYKDRRRQQP